MTIFEFLNIELVVLLSIFGAIVIAGFFSMHYEDKAREEHYKRMAVMSEQKRQEREAFEKAAWVARKVRMAALYK